LANLASADWSFVDADTRYLTHPIHRYSSKLIPQIPRTLIAELSRSEDLVLDNFVGSGTTLIEANLLSRHSIGVDLNPLACMITKAKTTPIPASILKQEYRNLLSKISHDVNPLRGQKSLDAEQITDEFMETTPAPEKLRRWYFQKDLAELIVIKNHISCLEDKRVRNLANVCFSEIVRKSSRAHSSYANVMLDRKARPKGKIFEYFRRQLKFGFQRVAEFSKSCKEEFLPEIICADAKKIRFLQNNCVDLIISHPPYLAAVPYAEFMLLSLLWFGIDTRKLDSRLLGGSRRKRDVSNRFLHDMREIFTEMYRILKSSGICCVVIGNPVSHGRRVQLNSSFKNLGEETGFTFQVEIPRKRTNMRKGILRDEYILIFTR